MAKNSNIIIRVDENLKRNVTQIAKDNGFKLTDILTASLKDVERRRMIPIYLRKFLPSQLEYEKISISKIKKCLNDAIVELAKGKVKKVYLFGSYARGEENVFSDIDIRIVPDDNLSLFDVTSIKHSLTDVFKKEVDVICGDSNELDPIFYEHIKKDEICIYEK